MIIHDLRHTTTTVLQQSKVDARTIQSMRGDRRIDMQNYYSHASTDSRHDAMQVMEEKFGRRDVRPVQPTEKQLSMTEVFELVKSGNITEVEFAEKIAAITGSATK